jgi:hypothetical protein
MKRVIVPVLVLLVALTAVSADQYYSSTYFYSIDYPGDWYLADESNAWNTLFRNTSEEAFAEVTVIELSSANSNADLFDSFINRYSMQGSYSNTTFCQYDAVRGVYTLNFNGASLKMDMVVFKDSYFYYVVMGYSYSSKYTEYQDELYSIVQSVQIYYDNNVIYSNDKDSDFAEVRNEQWDSNNSNSKSGVDNIRMEWNSYKKTYDFLIDDYQKAVSEVDTIINSNIWDYYGIDTYNDPDYNFNFWSKFYQDIFTRNYYRVNDVVEWFENESASQGWSTYELADNVMKAIQYIEYERPYNMSDAESLGASQLDFLTPNEVARQNQGDCDTKSMFMVIVLKRLGIEACMYHSADYGHAMVGININASGTYKTYNGKKYYFIESTYPGWAIGDLPPQMPDTDKWRIIPII